jgi:hypothetical protein
MKYFAGFVLIVSLVAFIYSASAKYVPIRTSIANSIDAMTIQRSEDQIQARRQNQSEWAVQQAEKELVLSERNQISPDIIYGWKSVLPWLFGTGAICLAILFFSATYGVSNMTLNLSRAAADRARLVARQIPLDPQTGSFPMLVSEDGSYLVDMNNFTALHTNREYAPQIQFVDKSNQLRKLTVVGYYNPGSKTDQAEIIYPAYSGR